MEEVKKQGMESLFVPYEIALALKELGFDEPCIRGWDKNGKIWYHPDSDVVLDNPTFSQVFRFFREKYLLFGYPFPNDYQNYGYRIVEMTSDENKELVYDWGTKDTYEEAELECLNKLIKFVKEKK